MSRMTEDGRRIRGGKSVPRKQRGMCSSDPPLPPKLREEDELRAAKARNERKKAEKLKAAARALREKMHAKGVPGAAKPLSKIKGPSRADDADNISDSDDADDDAVPVGEEDASAVPDYFARRASRPRTQGNHPYPARVLAPLLRRPRRSRHRPAGQRQDPRLPSPRGGVCAAGRARQTENQSETPEGGRPRSSSRPRVSWRCRWRACAGSSEEPRPCVAWRCTAGRRRRTRRNSWRSRRRWRFSWLGLPDESPRRWRLTRSVWNARGCWCWTRRIGCSRSGSRISSR